MNLANYNPNPLKSLKIGKFTFCNLEQKPTFPHSISALDPTRFYNLKSNLISKNKRHACMPSCPKISMEICPIKTLQNYTKFQLLTFKLLSK